MRTGPGASRGSTGAREEKQLTSTPTDLPLRFSCSYQALVQVTYNLRLAAKLILFTLNDALFWEDGYKSSDRHPTRCDAHAAPRLPRKVGSRTHAAGWLLRGA